MSKPYLTNIDLNTNQLENAIIQLLGIAPTGLDGRIYHNSNNNIPFIYRAGAINAWKALGEVDSLQTDAASGPYLTIDTTTDGTTLSPSIDLTTTGTQKIVTTDTLGDFTIAGGITIGQTVFTQDSDVVNKAYVDAIASGLDWKESVRLLSNSNITGYAAGVITTGATTLTIDSVAVANGERVVLTGQTAGVENGIYIVSNVGVDVTLTRTSDFNTGDAVASSSVFIEEGTVYADSGWVVTSNVGSDVVGTNSIAWTQFTGSVTISGGAGIDVTTGVVSVDLAALPGLEFDAGGVTGKLRVKVGDGVVINASTGVLDVDVTPLIDTASGLTETTNNIQVNIDTNSFAFSTGAIALAAGVAGSGVSLTSGILAVDLATSSALAFTTNQLAVNPDGTTIQINGSNQLEVVAGTYTSKYTTTVVGVAGADDFTITHNLGTTDVTVSIRDTVTNEHVEADITTLVANSLHIVGNAVTGRSYDVTVIG